MSLHHFVVKAGRRFHACYHVPGTDVASSVVDCLTEQQALQHMRRLNAEQVVAAPGERRVVPGFYNEQMDLI